MGKLGVSALVVALVLPIGMLEAGATPGPVPRDVLRPISASLPSEGIRSTQGSDSPASLFERPSDIVKRSGDPSDPLTYARAERRLLARTWGPAVDWRAALATSSSVDGETPAESPEAPDADGRVRIPITSSDLDGDLNEDVVFFDVGIDENSFPTDIRLTALDGRSGRPLWSKDYGLPYDLLVFSPRDITGDEADDLLVVAMNRSFENNEIACPGTVCTYDDRVVYQWDVGLLSGPDGSAAWDRSFDGSIRYTGGYALQGSAMVIARHDEATNALIDIRPSKDIDGDELGDFTLNLFGYRGELISSQRVSSEDFDFSTHAEAISGVTGDPLFERTLTDNPGAALLVPAGEATGDGRADLLWTVPTETKTPTVCPVATECTEIRRAEMSVELIDGASFTSKWDVDIKDAGLVAVNPALRERDLTGDQLADVVLGLRFEDGSEQALALSGADGTRAWTFDSILTDPPSALGSIDGGPGSDVLFWEGWYPQPDEAPGVVFRIRLRRVDGATGTELFSTQHDLVEEADKIPTIFAYPAGDGDADGVSDIALATWQYSGWWMSDGTASTVLGIESGADGHEIVRVERARKALLFPGGDWVPGGPMDLFEGSTSYNDLDFELAAVEMPSGDELWRRRDVLYSALFGPLRRRGGGGDDIVYGRTQVIEEAPRRHSRIDVLHGINGAGLWGFGPGF
jgi:hypothetical protein